MIRHKILLAVLMGLLLLPGTAGATFSWDIPHYGSVNDMFEIEAFHTFVTNTGALPDTVMVHLVKNMPASWVGSLCESILCYPPFILDIDLVLAPGQTTELIMDLTPVAVTGTGTMDVTLTSKNNPADNQAAAFTVSTSGQNVLLVSSLSSGQTQFTDAVTAAGRTFTVWDQAVMGKARAVDLARFPVVVWAAGPVLNSVTPADMTVLDSYLAGGGHLLLSGQNLGFSYSDPISPFFDATATAWFQNTLGASYTANTGSTDLVTGAASDPVFGATTYHLNGGDGTNNNGSPDVFTATAGGSSSLTYSAGGSAAIWALPGAGKTLLAGFGIEGLSSAAERTGFMGRALDWFAGTVTAVGDDQLQPLFVTLPKVFPNPFNPRTVIHFTVGGSQPVPASVTVYDVQGRAVRHLLDASVTPGPRQLAWDGRDDQGRIAATGLYLARIRLGGVGNTVKMTLTK